MSASLSLRQIFDLLQVHSSAGGLPVSFQSPAYRELHICRARSLSEKPERQQPHHAARRCNFANRK